MSKGDLGSKFFGSVILLAVIAMVSSPGGSLITSDKFMLGNVTAWLTLPLKRNATFGALCGR
ncbi:MAG: hypothetical protein ACK5TA_00670, partial [bacterium]